MLRLHPSKTDIKALKFKFRNPHIEHAAEVKMRHRGQFAVRRTVEIPRW